MSKTNWKQREREAAIIIGGKRYPANQGGFVDVESDAYVVQVKERRALSLAELEALAVEIERVGAQKTKHGLVMVKRSAGTLAERDALGRQRPTPWLIVMTEAVFRELNGRLPGETLPVQGALAEAQ